MFRAQVQHERKHAEFERIFVERITITEPGRQPAPTAVSSASDPSPGPRATRFEPSPPLPLPILIPNSPSPALSSASSSQCAAQTHGSDSDVVQVTGPPNSEDTNDSTFSAVRKSKKGPATNRQVASSGSEPGPGPGRDARKTRPMHTINLMNLVMMVAGRIADSMHRQQSSMDAEPLSLPLSFPFCQQSSSSSATPQSPHNSTSRHSSTSSSSTGSNSSLLEQEAGADEGLRNKGSRDTTPAVALHPKCRWKRRALEEAEALEAEVAADAQSAFCTYTHKRVRFWRIGVNKSKSTNKLGQLSKCTLWTGIFSIYSVKYIYIF